MKVTLINHTQNAKELLIFAKSTRLQMSADNMVNIKDMSEEEMTAHLDYMVNTIKSSWEFLDMTFMIEGVTRAFTHQLVRNRMGSYAQQAMRILDMSDGFEYVTGPTIKTDMQKNIYNQAMGDILTAYTLLIESGVKVEDARGLLPTNICTNIVAKYNLRTLSDMMASRGSSRVQSEYHDVINQMYDEVTTAMPWTASFLRNAKHYACDQLESMLIDAFDGTDGLVDKIKMVDKVRTGA